MKKLCALFLAAVMSLIIVGTAFAAEVDLSSMSMDGLVALRNDITLELESRLIFDDNRIGEGIYIVGKDIRSGYYEFTVTQMADNTSFVIIELYEDQNHYDNKEKINNDGNTGYLKSIGDMMSINLSDGMILTIRKGSGTIQEVKPAWAP